MKLTEEYKKEIYQLRKNGRTCSDLSKIYGVQISIIKYLIALIDIHGINITKRSRRNHSDSFKEYTINRVIIHGESMRSVALSAGLSSTGMLHNWIRIYKENGYNVLNKKRGRSLMKKVETNSEDRDKIETKLEKLERENEYLRAEVAFLKKWNAVVQLEEKRKKKK